MQFKHAIVRPPGSNFASGLSTAGLGSPDRMRALEQHARYCDALHDCGVAITTLAADEQHADSTFVEDTAIVYRDMAVVTRPGAASRRGELASIRVALRTFWPAVDEIRAPGTVDGGDICQIEDHFLIGMSGRTNAEGAAQLAGLCDAHGHSSSTLDIRGSPALLHLKSGIAYLGDGRLVVAAGVPPEDLGTYELIRVAPQETYAANCIRVNDHVLVAAGFPQLETDLRAQGYSLIRLDMSEFRKMDGGLSCLSLRF